MSAAGFAELSQRYAAGGDLRMAQLAAWAADVHTLEDLLHEHGLDQAPDPSAQLAAIGESIAATLELLAEGIDGPRADGPLTARDLVGSAREAMVTTFDASVHGLLSDRFADLEHLDHARSSAATGEASTGSGTTERLAGRSPEELVDELRTAAGDCATMSHLLAVEGAAQAAARLSRQADAAAYEAYLVLAAMRAGDVSFATVDLRWDLLADTTVPDRAGFSAAVGAAEREALGASLRST